MKSSLIFASANYWKKIDPHSLEEGGGGRGTNNKVKQAWLRVHNLMLQRLLNTLRAKKFTAFSPTEGGCWVGGWADYHRRTIMGSAEIIECERHNGAVCRLMRVTFSRVSNSWWELLKSPPIGTCREP